MITPSHKRAKQKIEKRGRWAERLACLLLIMRGCKIIARRYRPLARSKSYGEIDIIAKRRDLIIFVEVKLRQKGEDAMSALTAQQQRKIASTARAFLAQQPDQCYARFDAVFFGQSWWPLYIANAWQDEA